MVQREFVAPTDPRWISTLDAITAELVRDSLVYRYNVQASPDGLAGEQATFSMVSRVSGGECDWGSAAVPVSRCWRCWSSSTAHGTTTIQLSAVGVHYVSRFRHVAGTFLYLRHDLLPRRVLNIRGGVEAGLCGLDVTRHRRLDHRSQFGVRAR